VLDSASAEQGMSVGRFLRKNSARQIPSFGTRPAGTVSVPDTVTEKAGEEAEDEDALPQLNLEQLFGVLQRAAVRAGLSLEAFMSKHGGDGLVRAGFSLPEVGDGGAVKRSKRKSAVAVALPSEDEARPEAVKGRVFSSTNKMLYTFELQRTVSSLQKAFLFQHLPRAACEAFVDLCELRLYQEGTEIIEQGTLGTCMHIIVEGEVEVVAKFTNGTERKLFSRFPGAFVGEFGLISDGPRRATVTAVKPLKTLIVTRGALQRIYSDECLQPLSEVMDKILSFRSG
jgi:hypothetical protein